MTDTIDATGVAPIIRPLLLLLAASGALWSWKKLRSPLGWLALFVILLMPLGFVVTSGGLARRSFAAAPFVMTLAAIGVVEIVRCLKSRRHFYFSLTAAAALIGLLTWQSLRDYFVTTANSPEMSFVYCEEFTQSVQYMKTLPPDARVYFLSDRWTFNYEPRQFLAPTVQGEDRSRQFGNFDLGFDRAKGRPVFIFVGEYKGEAIASRDRYPGGQMIVGPPLYRDANQPMFYAYWPPAEG